MSLTRGTSRALLAVVMLLAAPRLAAAACTVMTCNDGLTKVINNPACCGAQSCTLDGTITLNGPDCALDFDGRDVRLTGTLVIGSRRLDLRARSFTVTNTGTIDARGLAAGSPGGHLAVTTSTGVFAALGTIDLTGFARGGGSLNADVATDISVGGSGIRADAKESFGSGGTIILSSRSGGITIAGPVTANSGLDGLGGTVELDAGGGPLTLGDNATVSTDGDIGTITMDASGVASVKGSARVSSSGLAGSSGSGGTIDVTAHSLTLEGTMQATGGSGPVDDIGGDGGAITIETRRGALLLKRTATAAIVVSGAAGGSGGEVSLATDSPTAGLLTVDGQILGQGQGGGQNRPGGGGIIEAASAASLVVSKRIDVSGTGEASGEIELDGDRDVSVTAAIRGDDPSGGGVLTIEAGHDLTIGADLNMNATPGSGSDGPGGEIDLTAGNTITIQANKTLDVSGTNVEPGGIIGASAGGDVVVGNRAELNADGGAAPGGPGGEVSLEAGVAPSGARQTGNLIIDGDIFAQGKNSALAASILLIGCDVTISQSSTVDSTGTAPSANMVVGRNRITVNGKLRAQTTNQATHRVGTPPTGNGAITPAFVLNAQPECTPQVSTNCLVPCPACGGTDTTKQFPEDCATPGCGNNCDIHCRTLTCNDGNPCTVDTCDAVFGCVHEPATDGTPCNDNNACTANESCIGELCVSRTDTDCNDNNACTKDTCALPGGCVHTDISCNDNNVCTQTDICDPETGCINKDLLPCPAGKVCDEVQGCVEKPCTSSTQCDDENPCTEDTCVSNKCQSNPAPKNGTSCADSNVCNGSETCSNGSCAPGTPLECADNDACTGPDTCDPVLGCQNDHIAGCCNEIDDCPGHTLCTTCPEETHTCGTIDGCCVVDTDCDDHNPCTIDGPCDTQQHVCTTHTPVTDGRECGTPCQPATCNNVGKCIAGPPKSCPDDGNLCTDDFCDPASGDCTTAAIDGCCLGTSADECGSICLVCDVEAHHCSPVPGCVACDKDTDCDPDGQCVDAAQTGGFNACGPEAKCIQVPPVDCDDHNSGTNDVCQVDDAGTASCRHFCFNSAACDDHDACNGSETCNDGTCVAGPALSCEDGDACTIDSCDPARGCVATDAQGFASVRCELDNISAALATASTTDISAAVRSKIERFLSKARAKLDAGEAVGSGKKALKALAAVKAQAKMIRQVVKAAIKKRKLAPALGDQLLGASDGASKAAQSLRAQLRT